MKVLAIDDDADLLDNIGIILDMAGYTVFRADNGIDGLRLANEHIPDLIICDIMMPGMTGYEVLEDLQANSATSTIPLIFLTSQSDLDDIRRGMLAGADDYITKPFSEEDLLAAVQKRLEKRQRWELEQRIQFSQQLVQNQERELALISQELEPHIHQKLLHLKYWTDSQSRNPDTSKAMLFEAVQDSLNSILVELNRITYHIYPGMLAQLGLVLSLQWYFNNLRQQLKLDVKFETYAMDNRLESAAELSFYRIVQRTLDSLDAYPGEIRVVLWHDEQTVHLSITQLPPFDKRHYVHLFQLIEEYAHAIQATLHIRHDETQAAVYITLPDAVFQVPKSYDSAKLMLSRDIVLLVVNSSKVLVQHLETQANFTVIPHLFTDMDNLFQQIKHHQPHLTVLCTPLSAQILRSLSQRTMVILLSPNQDENFARQVLQEGVMGVIPTSKAQGELLAAIQTVLQGEAYVSASLVLNVKETQTKPRLSLEFLLTLREREILELILADLTHADIAAKLVISPRTVEKHRANIMEKLGLNSHTELILFALRHGLISPD